MKQMIKRKLSLLKELFFGKAEIKNKVATETDLIKQFQNFSFSQEGEDMVLSRYFEGKQNGTFIDVGAHHPFRFSNTYLFYKKGWRGINIDPLPESKELFDKYRPEDENLSIGISNSEQVLTYHMFNEPALNTFDEKEAREKDGVHNGRYFIIDKVPVKTKKLSTILGESNLTLDEIDFLSIDVEGLDIEVLESNDWNKFRPEVVLVEELSTNIQNIIEQSPVYKYLKDKNYNLYYRTLNTSFYIRK